MSDTFGREVVARGPIGGGRKVATMDKLDEHAFDFWVGRWNCGFDGGHATNTIAREFDGHVIVERFEVEAPQRWSGMSSSVYDPDLSLWRQTWVDQSGHYWHFVGDLVDGDPAFATPDPVDAERLHKRMVFSNIEADSFHWRWESSPDRETWTENWAIDYHRLAQDEPPS